MEPPKDPPKQEIRQLCVAKTPSVQEMKIWELLCQGWAGIPGQRRAGEKERHPGKVVERLSCPQSTLVAAANQAIKKVRSLLAEFGTTPGSRSRILAAATSEDSDDEWSKLLK